MRKFKNLKAILSLFTLSVVLIGCSKQTSENANLVTDVVQDDIQTDTVEVIIEDYITPNYEKSILDIERKAKSIIEYTGSITDFTTLGSKGTLTVAVGGMESETVKSMLFDINLETLVYDTEQGKVIDTTTLPIGSNCMVIAMDNVQTSQITPVGIILNPNDAVDYVSFESLEDFETIAGGVKVVTNKFAPELYYVDDKTEIISALTEQPISLDEVQYEDKLFVTVGEFEEYTYPYVEGVDYTEEDIVTIEQGLEDLNGIKAQTVYATKIAVYKNEN
jgi:hypothetical protein